LYHQAKLTLKEGDNRRSRWKVLLHVWQVILAAGGINEMRQGDIRHPIPYRRQTGAAANWRQDEGRRRETAGITVAQDAKTRIIAARYEQKRPLCVTPGRCRHPGALRNPLVNERLGKQPLASHPCTGDGPTPGQDIDLLFVDTEVLRHLFGTHKHVHRHPPSETVLLGYYRKKVKKITKNALFLPKMPTMLPCWPFYAVAENITAP
jgi:hypothetical protein